MPSVLAFETRGSIAWETRVPVVICTAYASAIWLSDRANKVPDFGPLAGVISGVVGLLIAFRSSSSYERWYEGRRLWADVQSLSRSLLRLLTLSLSIPHGDHDERLADALRLVPAFAFALMAHLRDQPPTASADLRALLPASVFQKLSQRVRSEQKLPLSLEEHDSAAQTEIRRERAILNYSSQRSLADRSVPEYHTANVPLAILGELHAALNAFHTVSGPSVSSPDAHSSALDTAVWANCLNSLAALTDKVTQMERIRDTQIPMAMAIHMEQLLALYILAVAPQLVRPLGWWCIPIVSLTAFAFYGIDRISREISMPFGTEPNDLPLDKYCADIRREYRESAGVDVRTSPAGVAAEERPKAD